MECPCCCRGTCAFTSVAIHLSASARVFNPPSQHRTVAISPATSPLSMAPFAATSLLPTVCVVRPLHVANRASAVGTRSVRSSHPHPYRWSAIRDTAAGTSRLPRRALLSIWYASFCTSTAMHVLHPAGWFRDELHLTSVLVGDLAAGSPDRFSPSSPSHRATPGTMDLRRQLQPTAAASPRRTCRAGDC